MIEFLKQISGYNRRKLKREQQQKEKAERMAEMEAMHKRTEKAYYECLAALAKAQQQGTIYDINMWR